ncbi:nuclear transport factor 2 family protein [Variovorax sp.]|uniref:nuclear transport factor 2 family protein n=1 Tax=Variovorax sp. TaxID=1871043 RepID=UPI002D26DDA6|nr:nuclear transport factor 2 family protein [Variovorax sp.]HYP85300.1 nuclear transport factor 2 family protein [Variovorax sp.]
MDRTVTAITAESVRALFAQLEHGYESFFTHVAEDVDWTVHGTHPLAGHYRSRSEFIAATFARITKVLRGGTQLRVVNVMTDGTLATVEMQSMATAANGMRFDNRYCWVVRIENDKIVQVRAYLDSALIQRLFDENQG